MKRKKEFKICCKSCFINCVCKWSRKFSYDVNHHIIKLTIDINIEEDMHLIDFQVHLWSSNTSTSVATRIPCLCSGRHQLGITYWTCGRCRLALINNQRRIRSECTLCFRLSDMCFRRDDLNCNGQKLSIENIISNTVTVTKLVAYNYKGHK